MTDIPLTSVSMGFHSLIEPYRKEMHDNPALMFERFGITDDAFQMYKRELKGKDVQKELAQPSKLFSLAETMSNAASRIVRTGDTTTMPELREHITSFLKMAASWVAAEVALGVAGPDQPHVETPGQLIRQMYLLLYSSEFRAKHAPHHDFANKAAWDKLQFAVEQGSGRFDELLPHCRALCGEVAEEFAVKLWAVSW